MGCPLWTAGRHSRAAENRSGEPFSGCPFPVRHERALTQRLLWFGFLFPSTAKDLHRVPTAPLGYHRKTNGTPIGLQYGSNSTGSCWVTVRPSLDPNNLPACKEKEGIQDSDWVPVRYPSYSQIWLRWDSKRNGSYWFPMRPRRIPTRFPYSTPTRFPQHSHRKVPRLQPNGVPNGFPLRRAPTGFNRKHPISDSNKTPVGPIARHLV